MALKMKPEAIAELQQRLVDAARADPEALKLVLSVLPPRASAGETSTKALLEILDARGGHPGALAEATLLCIRKSQDYNQGGATMDPHKIDRSAYFPFGAVSYAQMLHTKSQRFNSLTKKILDGGQPNFEGLRDTALDIINYAGFFVASQDKEGP